MSAVHQDLKAALKHAMVARDTAATQVLRTTIAAVDNAQAVPLDDDRAPSAGAGLGVGSTERQRAAIDDDGVRAVVGGEIAELLGDAQTFEQLGKAGRAQELRAQAAVLQPFA